VWTELAVVLEIDELLRLDRAGTGVAKNGAERSRRHDLASRPVQGLKGQPSLLVARQEVLRRIVVDVTGDAAVGLRAVELGEVEAPLPPAVVDRAGEQHLRTIGELVAVGDPTAAGAEAAQHPGDLNAVSDGVDPLGHDVDDGEERTRAVQ
jgi:hypothetical protein